MTAADWLLLSGWVTLVVTAAGVIIMGAHVWFFRGTASELGQKLRDVFLTDGIIYATTAAFGVMLLLDSPIEDYVPLQPLRIAALALNIWAARRLYLHYRSVR